MNEAVIEESLIMKIEKEKENRDSRRQERIVVLKDEIEDNLDSVNEDEGNNEIIDNNIE